MQTEEWSYETFQVSNKNALIIKINKYVQLIISFVYETLLQMKMWKS